MELKDKKFGFSKIITLVSIALFCLVLIKCFAMDFTTYMDTTFAATAVTVTGGICGTCIVWNLKKSQAENLIKIRMGMYGDIKDIELKYNEKMFKLKSKYRITDEELFEIKDSGSIDDFSDEVLQEMNSAMAERSTEADSDTEIQNY